jgi:hypothetical protein
MTDTPESNEGNPQYILADSDMATEDGRLAMLEAMQDPGTTREELSNVVDEVVKNH